MQCSILVIFMLNYRLLTSLVSMQEVFGMVNAYIRYCSEHKHV